MESGNIIAERPGGNSLATAALILGILGALGLIFVLPPFLFGATAIVLGLLSSDSSGTCLRAKIGIFMGALSMVMLILIIISAVHYLMMNPGFMENYFDGTVQELLDELEKSGVLDGSFT